MWTGIGDRESMVAVMSEAIYGLKTSGNAWYHELGKRLAKIGFKPSRIDGAFWWKLRDDESGHNYITFHVDDLMVAAKDPHEILRFLKSEFTVKGGDLPKDCLGLTLKVTDDGEGWKLLTRSYLDQ